MQTLAIDCGGTRSRALLVDAQGEIVAHEELGPGNLYASGAHGVAQVVDAFLRALPTADAVAAAVAGARTEDDRRALIDAVRDAGVTLPLSVYSDAHAALRAGGVRSGVVVIAGTGSAALAVDESGRESRYGGWGSVLGDEGSGNWMGRQVLSGMVRAADEGEHAEIAFRQAVLQHFGLASLDELRSVAHEKDGKERIASLAPVVLEWCERSSHLACSIVARAAEELSRLALLARWRGGFHADPTLVLAGGVLEASPYLRIMVEEQTVTGFAHVVLADEPAWGAYLLAHEEDRWDRTAAEGVTARTERINPRSAAIDRMGTLSILQLMNEEDATVPTAVHRSLDAVAAVVDAAVQRMRSRGRLIYVGAGTSGRLAMLDAVECVPTFGADPNEVIALIAGGEPALTRAVEGAEDDAEAARADVGRIGVTPDDVVVGVSASGLAPYVRTALHEAQARSAYTALLTSNVRAEAIKEVDRPIVVEVGPEVIAGSSRLKAGTAQKLVLNMISTAAMVRLGRTAGNRMVSVRPTNAKLRARAIRLVVELSGAGEEVAGAALEQMEWSVPQAALLLRLGSREAVSAAIQCSNGDPNQALRDLSSAADQEVRRR